MPTYEYACGTEECKGWGNKVEVSKSVHQIDTPEVCPECGREMVRQISLPARAHFKGSGFYETDYKKRT